MSIATVHHCTSQIGDGCGGKKRQPCDARRVRHGSFNADVFKRPWSGFRSEGRVSTVMLDRRTLVVSEGTCPDVPKLQSALDSPFSKI